MTKHAQLSRSAEHRPNTGPDASLPASTDALSPWYRRPATFIAAAAFLAEVGIVVAGPLGTIASPGTTTSAPRSDRYSLVSDDFWEPAPPAPAPVAAPAPPPPAAAPDPEPVRQAPVYTPPVQEYVAPPPPPPQPELLFRLDNPITAAFVSIKNNGNQPVGCTMVTVPVGGIAAGVNFHVPDEHFTVVGSQEVRVPAGSSVGPATGSSFHLTVNCDNGLSAALDTVY